MTETGKEQRRYALAISGGVCEVCGRPLRDGQPQGAHRIGNTKANCMKYKIFHDAANIVIAEMEKQGGCIMRTKSGLT